jgi:carbon storage regulator
MLILQRKANEALLIGDDIRIVVLRSDGGGTRLGIEAPGDVLILREEILDQMRAENVLASQRASALDGSATPVSRPVEPAALPSVLKRTTDT